MEIVNPLIESYINNLIPERNAVLQKLEIMALHDKVPIVLLSSIQFMKVLIQAIQPQTILEIGTAIGYSTLHMAEAAPNANVITIEIDQQRAAIAKQHFEEAGCSGRIQLIEGDAAQIIPSLQCKVDFVFIDAAKGKYQQFLTESLAKLNVGGVIVTDNILFRGLVACEIAEIERKHQNLVRKINEYNQWLVQHPELQTSILPIGDGLAFSYKMR